MQRIKTFIHDHPHIWWGLFLPVYLGIFFTIEHFITDNYWATQLPIDYKIPALPPSTPAGAYCCLFWESTSSSRMARASGGTCGAS